MSVAIYMEGGGQTHGTRAALRQGMEVFLAEIKNACRERGWRWRLVCCGSRNEAYQRFQNALANMEDGIVVLLVDAEDPVGGMNPVDHLTARDGWDFHGVDSDIVHLMVQTMEAWIVADPNALSIYYRQGFRANALPRRPNLEEVRKAEVAQALDRATERTRPGRYRKIHHARHLLHRIDPMTVRKRCPHCNRLFDKLLRLIRPSG